jgi:hypothetical protein
MQNNKIMNLKNNMRKQKLVEKVFSFPISSFIVNKTEEK